jgi:repressor LexA
MSRTPLTRRQKEILDYIEDFRRDQGISPTHREIRDQFGLRSYGTIHKHLRLLREKGLLDRQLYQRRGIQVVDEGEPVPGVAFYGRVAAGRPLEAIAGDETITVPPHLLSGNTTDHYVLQVSGESMVDEGIFDGDYVVVQKRERADSGEMVVALVDGEATLKRFFPEGAQVRLEPANRTMTAMRYPANSVRVQGIVVGLMRRF